KKHNSKPVHTAKEIEKLKNLFPYNIRQFNVYHNNEIVAGTTVFITKNVIHPQYISGNSSKNDLGSIDFLYDYLINDVFKNSKFFDFGPSNEENGRKLKEGILFWKESFGAKTVIQDFYEIKTASSVNLEDILI
ncbi:MAG TPA: GNAT family N-acetyltransferase, partial [Flavobacterium sp.]|nr:GNAT family N-acetyltransferase [Flavobacterium sp.]